MDFKRVLCLCCLIVLLVGRSQLPAQCMGSTYAQFEVNKISVAFNNQRLQFSGRGGYGYFYHRDSAYIPLSQSNGLWIGALGPQGALHVAATGLDEESDFKVGPYRPGAPYTCNYSFESATRCFRNGLKSLSNGKILALDSLQVLIYDPVTKQTITRPWPSTRWWVDALELPDGRVMFFGDHAYPTKNPVLFMDTVGYNFTGGPTLNWFHKESSATILANGKVLLAGLIGCEVFDPQTNASTAVPDMIYPRLKHAAVRLPNGDVMVFGGANTLSATGATIPTQRFNDTLGYWFLGPNLALPRTDPGAVNLADGRVMILGGTVNTLFSEIYDPIADSVYLGPVCDTSRAMTNVALLPNGDVVYAFGSLYSWSNGLRILDPNTGASTLAPNEDIGGHLALVNGDEGFVSIANSKRFKCMHLRNFLESENRWQHLWNVTRAEIDRFRLDFIANDVDFDRYPQIEIWPTHGSLPDGEDARLAPFVDVNGDGEYRPEADGDYPCIVGDEAAWWVTNDQGMHATSRSLSMGLQVEAMAYAFDCAQTPCPDTSLGYATFIHYEITNHSDTAWSNMYIGGIQNFGLAFPHDDLAGADSALSLGFSYNALNFDGGLFGTAPPAWGASVLPNADISQMNSAIVPSYMGAHDRYPSSPTDFYQYLQGHWTDSLPIVNNGLDGYPGTAPGQVTQFMYPSTAGFCGGPLSGWSQLPSAPMAGYRQMVQGSGPFSLQPGAQIQYDLGFFYGRDSSNLASVCALKDATATIRDWWQNQLDKSCWSTVVGREEPRQAMQSLRVVPNPVAGSAFAVEFGAGLMQDGQLELMDLQGRVLQRVIVPMGAERQVVEASRLPAGLYVVRLADGQQVRTARVVVW